MHLSFSEQFKQSSNLALYSPNSLYIAVIVDYRLVIRCAETLAIKHIFSCIDNLSSISWSLDSTLIVTSSHKLGTIQVFSVTNTEWTATISEGLAGLTRVIFTPTSRHLLSFSDYNLRITVWNLINSSATYLQYPKYNDAGWSWRADGSYFALLERRDGKDAISIFDCTDIDASYDLVKHFSIPTFDAADISWSPCGRFICFKVLVYYPDGRLVSTYTDVTIHGLGIKSVKWSPSSQFLAVGSYDEKIRLLNNYTWNPSIEFSHPASIIAPDIAIHVETPPSMSIKYTASEKFSARIDERPYKLPPTLRSNPTKANPKTGIGRVSFSVDGAYMSSISDSQPSVVWIWGLSPSPRQVACLVFEGDVAVIQWSPLGSVLCVVSGEGDGVLFWVGGTEEPGVFWNRGPDDGFIIRGIEWNRGGDGILMVDGGGRMCVGYVV